MRPKGLFTRSVLLWRRHLQGLLLSRLIIILCHMMAAAPMLLVLYPPYAPLALFSVALYWLMIPALRHNHAEMLMAVHATDVYLPLHLVSGARYGRKLLRTLGDHAALLLSLAPLMACIAYALQLYYGSTDSFTVLRQLSAVLESGDWLDGLMNRLGILLASLAPYVLARALLSWRPYGRAIDAPRGFMRGHRLRLAGIWLASLLSYLPFILIVFGALGGYAAACGDSVIRLLMNGEALPSPTGLIIALAAAVVISQPLCMLRQALLSAFVYDIALAKGESAHDAA